MQYDNKKYAEHLSGMVQFPTVSTVNADDLPLEAFFGLHKYLEEAYPLVHKTLTREIMGKAGLVFHWKGTGKSGKLPVLVCAHQDVVPEGDHSKWKYPPFSGHIDEEGMLWGRGCGDCKATMLAELEAVEALIADGFVPDFDIYMAFGYNEEIMGGPGAACQIISDEFKARGLRFGLVLDEGGGIMNMNGSKVAMIFASEKGYADHEFWVEDGGGHAAMPPEHNALGKLGHAMYILEENPMEPKLTAPVIQMFKSQSLITPSPMKELFADPEANWDKLKEICAGNKMLNTYIRTTTTPPMAQGSAQANILPEKASIVTNSRLLPGETLEDLEAHFKAVLPEYVHFRLLKGHNPPAVSTTDSPAYRLLERLAKEMHGEDVHVMPALVFGGTDSRYYCDLSDSVYRYVGGANSGKGGGAHAVNECLDTTTLSSFVEFFVRVFQDYATAE